LKTKQNSTPFCGLTGRPAYSYKQNPVVRIRHISTHIYTHLHTFAHNAVLFSFPSSLLFSFAAFLSLCVLEFDSRSFCCVLLGSVPLLQAGDYENDEDDPSSYKLYIGWVSSWFVREDGTKVYPPVDMCGFSVVEHSVKPEKVNEQQVVMWFQRSSCRRVIFNNKCAIVTNQYVDGKFAVVVYDFSAGLGCLRASSVSCLNEPNRMLGQASHELFFNPIHACLSSDKQRLAILCDSCEHFYSSFPSTIKDEFGCDGSMLLILFTISPCGRFFYRQHSSRDEVWIRYNKDQQSCKKWKLSYSPCQSILQVTYEYNKWCIQPRTHYPSAYFVRLTEHGIDRTTPIMNSKVKEISWENPESIAVSLKHGTVCFVHRKVKLRPSSRM
jgi:hypothetical protein